MNILSRLFYPVAFVVIVAMVYLALRPGLERGPVDMARLELDNGQVSVSGSDLRAFVAGADMTVELVANDGVQSAIMTSSRSTPPRSDGATEGVSFAFGQEIEKEFFGRRIEIAVEARALPGNEAPVFQMAYSTAGAGNSGWRLFSLGTDWDTYRFTYDVSPPPEGALPGNDYLGFWPDPGGRGRGIDVRSITLTIVDELE